MAFRLSSFEESVYSVTVMFSLHQQSIPISSHRGLLPFTSRGLSGAAPWRLTFAYRIGADLLNRLTRFMKRVTIPEAAFTRCS